ncbi:hypothetical protein DQ384_05590 [Sphaerisporangium album]|uniref:Uncharacterized protein n=1 Tax=Sphaerisporangium album TaxID=509200 RepID=A0A367FNN6_9ACTN|nr:hypothetical protein DQ384_05590 [Sphaerisporangium album]
MSPRRWDLAKTATAAQLDQVEPGWHIYYSVGLRRFVAIATWRADSPLQVRAATVEELREQMRDAELGAMVSLGGQWAWVA